MVDRRVAGQLPDSYDTSHERVRAAYGPETFARLVETKRRHDPKNLFRVNHNIPVAD